MQAHILNLLTSLQLNQTSPKNKILKMIWKMMISRLSSQLESKARKVKKKALVISMSIVSPQKISNKMKLL